MSEIARPRQARAAVGRRFPLSVFGIDARVPKFSRIDPLSRGRHSCIPNARAREPLGDMTKPKSKPRKFSPSWRPHRFAIALGAALALAAGPAMAQGWWPWSAPE